MPFPLLDGTMLGLSVAAPFGPISLLCVQRSLAHGVWQGLASGIGAATAHGLFAFGAVTGAGFLATYLTGWQDSMRLASGLVLVLFGLRTLLKRPPASSESRGRGPYLAFATSLAIALSNPMTILPYLAAAAAFAVGNDAPVTAVYCVAIGVVLGAMGWYATLTFGASMVARKLNVRLITRLNMVAGCTLIAFGFMALRT